LIKQIKNMCYKIEITKDEKYTYKDRCQNKNKANRSSETKEIKNKYLIK